VSAAEGTVYYLVFDRANGDVRRQIDVQQRLDCVWCLTTAMPALPKMDLQRAAA
jgi:hypothetical protein